MPLKQWRQQVQRKLLPAATALAQQVQAAHTLRRAWQDSLLELASAACMRACAHLRCAELELGGDGPAAGQGTGGHRCSGCREAHYS